MEPLPHGIVERVTHRRRWQGGIMPESTLRQLGVMDQIEPRGGCTTVELCTDDDGELRVLTVGYAVCNPRETYNKKLGRIIARGRALATLAVVDTA